MPRPSWLRRSPLGAGVHATKCYVFVFFEVVGGLGRSGVGMGQLLSGTCNSWLVPNLPTELVFVSRLFAARARRALAISGHAGVGCLL